jgi:hypothetical protein
MRQTHLRHLSIFVDEPDPGQFYWVLHESLEDAAVWVDVQASDESYPTWHQAFDEGVVQLLKRVPDEKIGPRTIGEDESTSPVG